MATRWFNPSVPQTLQISQFLLYIDAFFAVVGLLSARTGDSVASNLVGQALALAAVGAYIYGAWGIANERRSGYKVAVVAAFLPLASRVVNTLPYDGPLAHLSYVFLGAGLIGALFEYALIGLLLHSQSREYQRVWFS